MSQPLGGLLPEAEILGDGIDLTECMAPGVVRIMAELRSEQMLKLTEAYGAAVMEKLRCESEEIVANERVAQAQSAVSDARVKRDEAHRQLLQFFWAGGSA